MVRRNADGSLTVGEAVVEEIIQPEIHEIQEQVETDIVAEEVNPMEEMEMPTKRKPVGRPKRK